MAAEPCELLPWPTHFSPDELAELDVLANLIHKHVERIEEILANDAASPTSRG